MFFRNFINCISNTAAAAKYKFVKNAVFIPIFIVLEHLSCIKNMNEFFNTAS